MKRRREFTRREFIGGATGTAIGLAAGTSVLGGRSSFAQGAKAAEFEKKEWIIGFSNASETNTWRTALREAIEAEVKKHKNMKLFITDANDSPAKQVSDLEDLLAKKANGLIIGAATTDVANPILDRCEKEGIPVVIVDRKVNSEKYTTFVSSDNNFMATKALGGPADFVLSSFGHIQSLVNPPGNPKSWYLVQGPLDGDAEEWRAGARTEKGTWWEHWARWMAEQGGDRVPAAARLGSDRHPPMEAAPGTYVHQS